jgi:hypothetical protein
MTKQEFIKKINRDRKANKDKWLFTMEEVEGCQVAVKSYNTWIQVMQGDIMPGRYSGPMDATVKVFNSVLEDALMEILETSI